MKNNVKLKNYLPHSKLSSKLWKEGKLKDDVREKLLAISDSFIDYLGIPLDVIDITLTGSYANYNYTPYSDIDLHLMIDYEEVTDDIDLAKEFFHAKQSFWNDRHDITFGGIEVEIYPQKHDEPESSSGIFSVLNNKWILKPKKFLNKVDMNSINRKYKRVKLELEESIELAKKDLDYIIIKKFLKKIKKMRLSGLEKSGELSEENLVYKLLRDNGDLQKLHDIKDNIFDINLSI